MESQSHRLEQGSSMEVRISPRDKKRKQTKNGKQVEHWKYTHDFRLPFLYLKRVTCTSRRGKKAKKKISFSALAMLNTIKENELGGNIIQILTPPPPPPPPPTYTPFPPAQFFHLLHQNGFMRRQNSLISFMPISCSFKTLLIAIIS